MSRFFNKLFFLLDFFFSITLVDIIMRFENLLEAKLVSTGVPVLRDCSVPFCFAQVFLNQKLKNKFNHSLYDQKGEE